MWLLLPRRLKFLSGKVLFFWAPASATIRAGELVKAFREAPDKGNGHELILQR